MTTPNLVVIVADTLRRPETVQGYDAQRDMPFLTALAQSSTSFERTVAPSPWTPPSHRSLLLGTEPWESWDPVSAARSSNETGPFSKIFRELGGTSVGLSANPMVSRQNGILADYDHFTPVVRSRAERLFGATASFSDLALGLAGRKLWRAVEATRANGRSFRAGLTYTLTSGAASSLNSALIHSRDAHAVARELSHLLAGETARGPCHVFVNLMEAHEPYCCTRPWVPAGQSNLPLPTANLSFHSPHLPFVLGASRELHEAYLGGLRRLDRGLDTVFSVLRRKGVLANAVVCVTSDHGQSLGENGFFGHGWELFDEIVRVPALIWRPGGPRETSESDRHRWLDLRHMHDILAALVTQEVHSLSKLSADLRGLRGHAVSYVRGNRLDGFNPFRRKTGFQSVRVWGDEGDAQARLPNSERGQEPAPLMMSGPASLRPEITRLLDRTSHAFGAESGSAQGSESDRRLASWGYI